MRILLVEDNTRLAETIAKNLREQSFAVDIAFDGENALYEAEISDYDLIVLDVRFSRRTDLRFAEGCASEKFKRRF